MSGFDNTSQQVSYRFFRSQLQMLRNKWRKEGGWGVTIIKRNQLDYLKIIVEIL